MKIDIQRGEPISKYRSELEKTARLVFRDASALIPIDDVTIFIRHDPPFTVPELGVGGYTPNGKEIYISVDADHPKFDDFVIPNTYRTLLHEFHHIARWRGPGYGDTLFEALVTEGLADHFELEVTNLPCQPWDKALLKKEISNLLNRAEKEFDKKYSHEDWFYGSTKIKIPRWTGYALGFNIVGDYLKNHPKDKASSLYSTSADTFKT